MSEYILHKLTIERTMAMDRKNMRDVAARAGVSQATVSRVIHSPHLVKTETQKKILAVMEELGYVYNSMAADFTRQKNSMIGLIIFTAKSSIHAELIDGMQDRLKQSRYSLIIGNSNFDPQAESDLIRLFRERQLAAVVVAGATDENRAAIARLENESVPAVLTWELTEDPSLNCVGFDNYGAARRMTEYLIALGHRRIGLIVGLYGRIERVRKRLEGYKNALIDGDIEFDPTLVEERIPTLMDGKIAMEKLMSRPDRPTAVFAASDVFAFGALAAARELGYAVPRDVSVAGFDDIDFAAFCSPPLTTIRVPAYEMGRRAAEETLKALNEPTLIEKIRVSLATELIVRESCGPPSLSV